MMKTKKWYQGLWRYLKAVVFSITVSAVVFVLLLGSAWGVDQWGWP
ncbi:hypothetical protein [Chromobacterium sp. Panama]|nr:hypothetical protein [Chromobacterium sp. Panama]